MEISWPGKTVSLTQSQAGFLCCMTMNKWIQILYNRFFKNIPHGISVSLEIGSQSLISFSTQRGKVDTKSSPERRNNEANMSWWNSVSGLSPPAWLPHKGHQSSAETAQSRGLSFSAWVDTCVHKGERREKKKDRESGRVAYLMLTGQFQAVVPDGPVWPLIPQAIVQVSICLHAHAHRKICIHTGINKTLLSSRCFSFQFLP